MSSNIRLLIIITVISLFLSQCATVINGRTQQVSICSYPSDAEVQIDGDFEGYTPLIAELKRKNKHTVRIDMDGYEPYELILTKKVSGWVALNILFGGVLIGLAIDASTGSMYRLAPEDIQAELESQVTMQNNGSHFFVKLVDSPGKKWQKIGQLTPSHSR